jgi:hypothetical protein
MFRYDYIIYFTIAAFVIVAAYEYVGKEYPEIKLPFKEQVQYLKDNVTKDIKSPKDLLKKGIEKQGKGLEKAEELTDRL